MILLDEEDQHLLEEYTWWVSDDGYARTEVNRNTILMHIMVQEKHGLLVEGLQTDHRNRNPCDNRKENLRQVTPSINNHNRNPSSRYPENAHLPPNVQVRCGGYRGLITVNYRSYRTGTYKTAEEARAAVIQLKKDHGVWTEES